MTMFNLKKFYFNYRIIIFMAKHKEQKFSPGIRKRFQHPRFFLSLSNTLKISKNLVNIK